MEDVLAAMTPETRSALTFTIEQYLESVKPKQSREDWEGKTGELKEILIKEKIALERSALIVAEQEGDETAASLHIKTIDNLRHKLHSR